ncbi:MAG: tRNA (adenosine(37)-N6)-threonylcarbamoyltransferase complex transferase subunit TsaD [Lentisphaerae bacterium RIFOXYA12_64_32]|nr:MAG: tRNA (adenosine(37)-N6)-threonylcarbamoyltransferase complex transferase subunit TsaD [Lentisphaerae bacterium RIFOXYA12_64_32]
MVVLGIETSCDDTAAAVVRDGREVLASVVSSQIAQHAGFGGVVPELAAREHLRAIQPVVETALRESNCTLQSIDAVAVTNCPGLVPSLLVGVSYAKGVAAARGCALVGVNHFLAHIYGALLDADLGVVRFPVLALVVSGGHTALALIEANGAARILGATLDDAAGEAFDKAAKILDLGYPGGPIIDRLAKQGNPVAIHFPRPLMGGTGRPRREEDRFNFSFSGVKTALLYAVKGRVVTAAEMSDLVASYQAAVVDVLVAKTLDASREFRAGTVVVCGGVACNSRLRQEFAAAFAGLELPLRIAPPRLCTDNAAMVAGLAYHSLRHGVTSGFDLAVRARLDHDLETVPFAPGVA